MNYVHMMKVIPLFFQKILFKGSMIDQVRPLTTFEEYIAAGDDFKRFFESEESEDAQMIKNLYCQLREYAEAVADEHYEYPLLYDWNIIPTRSFLATLPCYQVTGNVLAPQFGSKDHCYMLDSQLKNTNADHLYIQATRGPKEGFVRMQTPSIRTFCAHKTGRMFVETVGKTYELVRLVGNPFHDALWTNCCLIDQLHDDEIHALPCHQI